MERSGVSMNSAENVLPMLGDLPINRIEIGIAVASEQRLSG